MGFLLAFMNREIRGLHEAAYLLALFAFLSQVLALARDRVFAHFFGAGHILDAYFAAFKIPDLLFAYITLFVSSFALIPLLAARGGVEDGRARSLLGSVFFSFGFFSILMAGILFVVMPILVPFLFPGFSTTTQESVVMLSRIMLLQPLLLGFSSIIASVVQSARKFVLYALAPIFYNLGIIVGALFLYPVLGIAGLGWGVVLGASAHFAIQIIPFFMGSVRVAPRFSRTILADTYAVVRASLPRALALSSNQILMLVLMSSASVAAVGSVAAFSFAFNLQSVPLSIIGVSYASALFPALAALFVKGEREAFTFEVWTAVRHIIFWTTPAIVLMIVLRAHIVRVILGSGAFSWNDTRLTAAILAAFLVSLIAQALLLIFSRAYYATHKEWTPIIMNIGIAVGAGICAYLGFQWFHAVPSVQYFIEHVFRIDGISGSGVVMLALGYSFALIVGVFIFSILFAIQFGFDTRVLHTLSCTAVASIFAGSAAYGTRILFGPLLPSDTFVGIFLQASIAGVSGGCAWALALWLVKSREFSEVVTLLVTRARRTQ
jgi:putative peptidoglycan lipid II flippase